MAKTQKQSTVTVGAQSVTPVAPVVAPEAQSVTPVAPVVATEQPTTKKEKRSAKRALKQVRGADGKPVHKLDSVESALAAGYVFGKHALVRAQFVSAHAWYVFCAWRAEQEAQQYHAKAADALANPAAYKRTSTASKAAEENKRLADKLAKLEALLASMGAQLPS